LLLLRAWLRDYRYEFGKSWGDLDLAEPLVSALPASSASGKRLRGELDALRSNQYYHQADADRALAAAERATQLIPDDFQNAKGFAFVLLGGSLQMRGDLDQAYRRLYDGLEKTPRDRSVLRSRLLITLCWVHWMAGDLAGLRLSASRLLQFGRDHDLPETTDFARYFSGIAHYNLDELTEAETQLATIAGRPFLARAELYPHGSFALALVHLARGRSGEATDLVEALATNLLESENAESIALARAFRAELAIRQGRLAEAGRWAEQFDPEPLVPAYMFYVPQLTLAKLLIAKGGPERLRRADGLLGRLHDFFTRTHNRRFLIDVLALRALLLDARDDEPGALSALEQAVVLAQAGGFTRVFADVGPGLADLLHRLELDEAGVRYVGQALAAFHVEAPAVGSAESRDGAVAPSRRRLGIDPLSKREDEILALLADRLTNPEISEQLHISTVTVKRHVANIFRKLGVHDRRSAVAKAFGLGLLGG